MTREYFEKLVDEKGFNEAMSELNEEKDEVTDYDTLKRFVIEKIEADENMLALHIWNAVYHTDDGDSEWYRYDYTAGTTDKPTYLQTVDDVYDANLLD